MANAQESPEAHWLIAKKLRHGILKELDAILKSESGSAELRQFDKIEAAMSNYRLPCIAIIWADIRFAGKENVSEGLWQTHVSVTGAYRKSMNKLARPDQIVLKRKLEKLYQRYLKTAHEFYKGFLQRFCARFNLEELKRIASEADLGMTVPDHDQIDAKSEHVTKIVSEIGHMTLIYLGDLSRYRTMLKTPERRMWENALTYYCLANDLMPESGYGHHQCGVVFIEAHDRLSVLYHLYRSATSKTPHPNAQTNLDRELTASVKHRHVQIPKDEDPLVYWFRRLLAHLNKGEEFQQHGELVGEVLHRLRLALQKTEPRTGKGPSDRRKTIGLLKMVLTNMCAYRVSLDKVNKHWTNDASRSCQFILQLNIRMFDVIARQLGSEARQLLDTPPAEMESNSRTAYFPATFTDAVPLLRVYMAWTYYYRSDLTKYKEHLAPHFDSMCTALGLAMGHLLELAETNPSHAKIVPVLCVEDIETLGMQCLHGSGFPSGCALDCDPVSGKTKSRESDYKGRPVDADDVTFTRLVSTLKIAHALRTEGFPFPWPTTPESADVDDHGQDGRQPAVLPDTPPVVSTQLSSKVHVPDVPQNSADFNVAPELPEFNGGPTTDDMDNTVLQMVNDFLVPPEATKSMGLFDDTSYGMGSATAKDVFGAMPSPAAGTPTSATTKTLQTLPWEFFHSTLHPDPRPVALVDAGSRSAWNHGLGPVGPGTNCQASEPRPPQSQYSPQDSHPGTRPGHQPYPPQFSGNVMLFDSFPSSVAFSNQGSSLPPVQSPWGVPRQSTEHRPLHYLTPAPQGHPSDSSADGRQSITNSKPLYDDGVSYGTTMGSWGHSNLLQPGSSPLHATLSFPANTSALVADSAVCNQQSRTGIPGIEDEFGQQLPKTIGTRLDRRQVSGRIARGHVS